MGPHAAHPYTVAARPHAIIIEAKTTWIVSSCKGLGRASPQEEELAIAGPMQALRPIAGHSAPACGWGRLAPAVGAAIHPPAFKALPLWRRERFTPSGALHGLYME